ncbi:MAG: fibrobacter succinogenes major paralogous domain-containing protein [Flavobacterium sp.]|nr:fibrobacter succinogenes major paralogous domain-containing protein [Flavobacterium sp.]
MKKEFLKFVLLAGFVFASGCSDDINKAVPPSTASRPTVPVLSNEVTIGNQIWMAKNLNISRYRNGDVIPQVQNASQWSTINYGAWCYYENNSANGPIYGKLYNLAAIKDPRGLAPIGWHIPNDDEWTTLFLTLGGFSSGGQLKSTNWWEAPNTGATNSSFFAALPGGKRDGDAGTFLTIGQQGNWWSRSLSSGGDGNYYRLFYNLSDIGGGSSYAQFGYSVRCVKD